MPFCTPLCGWPSLPCSGISGQGGSILPKPSLPVPAVCPMQQRLCGRETKSARPAHASGMVREDWDAMGRRNWDRRRGHAPGAGDRLPHPDWHHSASDGVILFQHRNITRRAVVLPCHPDMHMAFSQQRPTILLGAAFVGHSQRAGVAQPLYAGHDSRFSVCPCRRRIYDIVLSFSWPLPRHTLETGQMA